MTQRRIRLGWARYKEQGRLVVLQALVGVNIALTSGVLWLAFTILGRLPR